MIFENQEPRAYGSPNGDASISNGGVTNLTGGFSDIEGQHDYSFAFSPDVTVDYFSLHILDYGDYNPDNANEHSVALVAYDANDGVVDTNMLTFTSDGQTLPRDGSAGDLWFTGDAISSSPGEPGNFTFTVSGNAITRVALEFSSDLGVGVTDPFFALADLCFSTEELPIDPPSGTICADFSQLPVGAPVEGLGAVHPNLNINTTGNAIVVAETEEPRAYGAPNGDGSITNGGVDALLNGFVDETQVHEYGFAFGPDISVEYFAVNMLDYGDFNPLLATEHSVSLVAYDIDGNLVDINTLSYTSEASNLPRSGSAGDLWLSGDAITGNPGDPGNYTFFVSGSGITRLELQFSSNLGPGATDPNFALSVLCFSTEDVPIDPPSGTICADFSQLSVGAPVEGLGAVHPNLNINTTGNAIVVAETEEPRAYGAPNGDGSITNGGVDALLNGFVDETQVHEYGFAFGPDISVEYFAVNMLDYGDFNPLLATEHSVLLVAYDIDGNLVDINTLSYTSEASNLPRSGSAGDLWLSGDAITGNPGDPGNYTFFVSGSGITRLELQFSSNLGPGATDPNFALSVLCFSTEDVPIDPPSGTICADFSQLSVGAPVEGLGTVHPNLNINTTGNAIVVAETEEPRAYGAPNGDGSITNGGVDALLNGFVDETQVHEYGFAFGPDISVEYFAVNMLDYGDFNPLLATEHSVLLVAYDIDGNLVDINSLSYTSEASNLPRSGSAGDLWLSGDAITGNPGDPGNYTFFVSGSGITRLELQFSSNLGPGATDPNFALSVLCFQTEDGDGGQGGELDPPTAVLDLLRPKEAPEVGGKYLVEYACSENAPNLVSATINGYDVTNGQDVTLIENDTESARIVNDQLIWLFAPEFSFDVTCADDDGNEVSTSVVPDFMMP